MFVTLLFTSLELVKLIKVSKKKSHTHQVCICLIKKYNKSSVLLFNSLLTTQNESLCLTHLFISVVHLILQDHLPTDLAAVIDDDVHFSPCAELSLPVGDGGERGDDEERSP